MLERRPGMIEDQRLSLSRRWSQASAYHLTIKAEAFGWAAKDKARDRRLVPALGQHPAVANKVDGASRQLHQDPIALLDRDRAVKMLGQYAGTTEFVAEMNGMRNIDCEHNRWATPAEAEPVFDDIADQLCRVHSGSQFALDVVAASDMKTGQIWPCWRINSRPNQVTARNKIGDAGALDHHLENIAEASSVAAAWRGRQADNYGVRIRSEQAPVRRGSCVMGFVYDDKIGRRQLQ